MIPASLFYNFCKTDKTLHKFSNGFTAYILLVEKRNAVVPPPGSDCYSTMDSSVFFVFLALSTIMAANVAADWPLMDTIFMRVYRANNSNIDVSLKNVRDIVSLLDKNQTTVIYIHGYLENVEMGSVKTVTTALLNYTSDNVCSLDYRYIASLDYPTAVEYAPHVGAALATAIDDMAEAGLDGAAVHLIGLSLGGQICGFTGRNTTEKVKRITGLDPAGPLFDTVYLKSGDAWFVCIIHTDRSGLGNAHLSGDVNCNPNLGNATQPGCVYEDFQESKHPPMACSHERSWHFFAESVSNRYAFPSVKCDSDSDFINSTCDRSNIIPMGYYTPYNASGVYYCQTNSESLFNLGMPGTVYNSSRDTTLL